jgi:hypothetical protein
MNFTTNMNSETVFTTETPIDYGGKKYYVLTIHTEIGGNNTESPLVIDFEDYPKIKDQRWCRVGKYIGTKKMVNYEIFVTYMHQVIMNCTFDGKNYVDHIDRICTDNRKENLRMATQTEQNWNQKKRKRTTKLPDGCGIEPDDIPTNIEFHPESGYTGACFEVVIKSEGKRVCRKKSTKSKSTSLIHKLNEAKEILKGLMVSNPEWFANRCLNGCLTEVGDRNYESYHAILKLANTTDPFNPYVEPDKRISHLLD